MEERDEGRGVWVGRSCVYASAATREAWPAPATITACVFSTDVAQQLRRIRRSQWPARTETTLLVMGETRNKAYLAAYPERDADPSPTARARVRGAHTAIASDVPLRVNHNCISHFAPTTTQSKGTNIRYAFRALGEAC